MLESGELTVPRLPAGIVMTVLPPEQVKFKSQHQGLEAK